MTDTAPKYETVDDALTVEEKCRRAHVHLHLALQGFLEYAPSEVLTGPAEQLRHAFDDWKEAERMRQDALTNAELVMLGVNELAKRLKQTRAELAQARADIARFNDDQR
jgi:uncharacterized small protein (DUF1192 family)